MLINIILLILILGMLIGLYLFRKGEDKTSLLKKEEKILRAIEKLKIQKILEENSKDN